MEVSAFQRRQLDLGREMVVPSDPVSPRQLSAGEGVGARGPAGVTAAERCSLTPPSRGSLFSWAKMTWVEVFFPLPRFGEPTLVTSVLDFGFLFCFCFSWILLSSFPPYYTSATPPLWSCPSGSSLAPLASMQPTCSSGKSMPQ